MVEAVSGSSVETLLRGCDGFRVLNSSKFSVPVLGAEDDVGADGVADVECCAEFGVGCEEAAGLKVDREENADIRGEDRVTPGDGDGALVVDRLLDVRIPDDVEVVIAMVLLTKGITSVDIVSLVSGRSETVMRGVMSVTLDVSFSPTVKLNQAVVLSIGGSKVPLVEGSVAFKQFDDPVRIIVNIEVGSLSFRS
uniref:Uncharacterized protein n=1 Tax=Branchiostoma floridae TaxID=7739 RepID=C3ZCX5_BRAFL|eukprot:XP_002593617.1 hypothetical protein BRAFLDRAFT_98739 [Branchiostoma floridae]